MTSKLKKSKSKRGTTRLREGIKKKISAHNKKQKKLAKKDPTWKSRHPKDPGIPSSFPFKEQILEEIEEKRRINLELKAKLREERRQALVQSGQTDETVIEAALDQEERNDNSNRLAALVESAQAAAKEYEGDSDNEDDDAMEIGEGDSDDEIEIEIEENDSKDSSRKAFDKIFKTVIDRSDIILYVLDSRDPEGTRSRQVEQAVLSKPDKRILFVLNKIDLVPSQVLKQWHSVLRLTFPTLPLAAASAAPNAQTFIHKGLTRPSTASALLQALKAYANKTQLKRAITVGVVGYPNVGKSSVINALLSRHGGTRKACPVGAQAGVTTSIRQVKIDNKLKVLDSPGIVFPSTEGNSKKNNPVDEQSRLILLNALPPKQIDDPIPAVSLLLKRLLKNPELKDRLMVTYELPPLLDTSFNGLVTDFLVHVARKKGRLGKGGIPNIQGAAQAIIIDWRDGRIAGWTLPEQSTTQILDKQAEEEKKKGDLVISASQSDKTEDKVIVTEWAQEFSLDGLWDGNFGGDDDDVEMES